MSRAHGRRTIPELQGLELVVEGRKGEQPRTLARWGASSLTYRAADFDYRVAMAVFFRSIGGLWIRSLSV